MATRLSSKDREVYRRIVRDIEGGRELGILSEEDYFKLKGQAEWAAQAPAEWKKLKALHHARSAKSKFFGQLTTSGRRSEQRLQLARPSYLKMLAQNNEAVGVPWDYDAAKVWKQAVLDDASYRRGGVLADRDPLETFRKGWPLVTIRARSGDAVQRGDLGAVTSFRWRGQKWAFKPADDRCLAPFGVASGIPANGARMHDRSVAFYLLAKALGVERLVVETRHAFLQTRSGLQVGILMRYATGKQPMTMQQRPDLVRRHLQAGILHDKDAFDGLCRMPHVLGSLTEALLCSEALLRDFFSASWLDYLGAQMDRHLSNLYVDIAPGSGKYQGLQLIDNDMCFGTETDPNKLSRIQNGKNKGIPGHVPTDLGKRITQLALGIPSDGRRFWRQAREGGQAVGQARRGGELFGRPRSASVPTRLAPPSRQPLRALEQELDRAFPRAQLAEVARLLSEQEFVALTARLRKAAAAVVKCKKVGAGSGKDLKKSYSTATKQNKVHEFSLASYWHELYWMTSFPDQFHKIRENPRDMSHEEFVRRLQRVESAVRPALLAQQLQLTRRQKAKLDPATGLPTVAFLEELFKTGKGRALNPRNAAVQIEATERSGAATGALFKLRLGTERYLVKVPARLWEVDGGTRLVATSAKRPVLVGDPEVELYGKIAAKSRLWQTRTIKAPDDTVLALALPAMTLTYTVTASVCLSQGMAITDPRQMVVKHQICVLPLAKGVRVTELLEERPDQAASLLAKLGSAIGAFHKQFAVKEVLPTGGHRTYVHGDFFGSNVFYDEHENLATLIDLTPLAANFVTPKACCGRDVDGHDMLHDLARLFTMTLQSKLWEPAHKRTREAVYQGYLASFPNLDAKGLEQKLQAVRKTKGFAEALG